MHLFGHYQRSLQQVGLSLNCVMHNPEHYEQYAKIMVDVFDFIHYVHWHGLAYYGNSEVMVWHLDC